MKLPDDFDLCKLCHADTREGLQLERNPQNSQEEPRAEPGRRGRARKGTLTTAANPVKI
ncbi:unnamed protein product [Boreogadus saida]